MASYSSILIPIGSPFAQIPSSQPQNPKILKPNSIRRRRTVQIVKAEVGINPKIRKTEDKVVDSIVISEISKPVTAYCRCWRSGTFPLCDGSHVKHNKATGDNVGPLLVKK